MNAPACRARSFCGMLPDRLHGAGRNSAFCRQRAAASFPARRIISSQRAAFFSGPGPPHTASATEVAVDSRRAGESAASRAESAADCWRKCSSLAGRQPACTLRQSARSIRIRRESRCHAAFQDVTQLRYSSFERKSRHAAVSSEAACRRSGNSPAILAVWLAHYSSCWRGSNAGECW